MMLILSSVTSAPRTLITSVPSFRIPVALITVFPRLFVYAVPYAMVMREMPCLNHVLSVTLLSVFADSVAV